MFQTDKNSHISCLSTTKISAKETTNFNKDNRKMFDTVSKYKGPKIKSSLWSIPLADAAADCCNLSSKGSHSALHSSHQYKWAADVIYARYGQQGGISLIRPTIFFRHTRNIYKDSFT